MDKMCYKDWVKAEAARINSDGCSVVSEIYHWCCLQHDLCYFYARDPRDAYLAYKDGVRKYWSAAGPIDKAGSDALFRSCMESLSPLKKLSVVAWFRWMGVKVGGGPAWNQHRARKDGPDVTNL